MTTPQTSSPDADAEPSAASETRKLIVKNTLYLSIAEVLAIPLSIVVTGLHSRFLGATGFGLMYSAGALCALGFLAVDWGQAAAMSALIARDHSRAGTLLGTSMAWRVLAGACVYVILAAGAHLLGYDPAFQSAFLLMYVGYGLSSLVSACQDAVRGFERTDIAALARVANPIVTIIVVGPVLLLGAPLAPVLVANAGATVVVLLLVASRLKSVGIGRLAFSFEALKQLLVGGTPFVALGVVLVLQPQIDAYFLARLTPPEVMGWYAGARKLIGVLVFPCSALVGALYPTMARLHGTDPAGFARTANESLRAVALLAVPVALGCFCFPELGTSFLGEKSYAPAVANLRIMAVFLLLVYVSMPIGVCVIAGTKQRAWAVIQAVCVLSSLVLDPLLVPLAQSRFGNGGLGVSAAAVVAEIVVVVCGMWMLPRGAVDGRVFRSFFLAASSGLAMGAVAWALRDFHPLLVAPLSLLAYAAALRLTGAIDQSQVAALKSFFERKLGGLRRRILRST